jgi:hypothetical protein
MLCWIASRGMLDKVIIYNWKLRIKIYISSIDGCEAISYAIYLNIESGL